jgi:hypothetical protein
LSCTAAYFVEQRKEAKGRDVGVLLSLVTFGAKVAVEQRALGGHNLYGHCANKRK